MNNLGSKWGEFMIKPNKIWDWAIQKYGFDGIQGYKHQK